MSPGKSLSKKSPAAADPSTLPLVAGQDLRRQAEAQLSKCKKKTAHLPATEADAQYLIHELQVHQIELELQNEELLQARAEAEAALRQYTDLYEFAPVGYFTLARDGAISRVNLAGANLLGAGAESKKLLQRRLGLFVSVEFRIAFNAFLDKVFTSREKEVCEIELLKNGAAPLWVHIEATTDRGEHEICRAVVVDISERKQAEEALRESEDKFKYFFDHSSVGYSLTLPTGEVNANQSFCEMLGYTLAEFKSKKWQEITHPQDIKLTQKKIDQLLSGKRDSTRFIKRLIHKDGSVVWVDLSSSIRRDKDGQPLYFMTTINDITERVQAEEAIRRAEKRSGTLIENAPDGIVFVSIDGKFTYASPTTYKLFGYDTDQMSQLDPNSLTHPDDLPRVLTVMSGVIQNPSLVTTLQYRFRHQDGRWLWIESTFSNLIAEPSIQAIVINFRDITERKQAEEALRAGEERFALVIDASEQGIWDWNVETNEIFFSEQWKKQIGYHDNELKNDFNTWVEHLHPDESEYCQNAVYSYLNQPVGHFILEFRFRNKDGNYRWIHNKASSVRNNEGKVIRMFGTHTDITERKQAEDALRTSQQLAESIIESIPGTFYMLDEAGKYVRWSAYQRDEIIGKPDDQIAGFPAIDTIHPDDRALIQSRIANVLRTGVVETIEGRVLIRGGPKFQWLLMTGRQLVVAGHPYLVGIGIDISERKQAEDALRESEERFRSLYENATIGMYRTSPDGQILMANPALIKMLGHENFDELAHRDLTRDGYGSEYTRHEFQKHIEQDGEVRNLESAWKHKDGTTIFVVENAHLMRDEKDQPLYYEGTVEDITARKQAEEENRQQSEQLRLLYEAGQRLNQTLDRGEIHQVLCEFMSANTPNDGFVISDFDPETQLITCRAFWMDNKWLDVSGFPPIPLEAEGKGTQSIAIRSGQPLLIRDLQAQVKTAQNSYSVNAETNEVESEAPAEEEEIPRSALVVPLKLGGIVTGVIQVMSYRLNAFTENQLKLLEALALHISAAEQNALLYAQVQAELNERKLAEEKLAQYSEHLEEMVTERTRALTEAQEKLIRQDRLAVLGQLAGGVSHELRNPLGIINSAIYYLKMIQPGADDEVQQYHVMIEQEVHNSEKIINDLLDFARGNSADQESVSVLELVQSVLIRFPAPPSVEVVLKISTDLPRIFADPRQLEQVLGNLTTNAYQAMANSGKLTITAHTQKELMVIAVNDTGTGITPENMQKVFEPLFTTKCKGIGLGLAVSKKLVEANGGRIEVKSQPGKGSTFTVTLPFQNN